MPDKRRTQSKPAAGGGRAKAEPRPGELPEEFQLRRLVARAHLKMVREAMKKAGLGTHAAADVGRRNRDWRANNSSADLAVIPDSLTLIGRSRQLVRDTWVGKSLVRAFARNVVGRTITVIPHAKDPGGKPLTDLNRAAQREWTRWSRNKKACDVERKQTFAQKLRLAAKEKFAAGEHLWMWVYRPPAAFTGGGGGRPGGPVGLSIQAFEPEQFDLRLVSYEGREVRGGVEVDENGAPLAYHLYTRNPNDVLYRHAFFSERVPADRIFHYFEGERVLQTRGVTAMTPVMQDIRDLQRGQGATLTRFLMEACIGVIIKSNLPVTGMGGRALPTLPLAAGDDGQTASGMTQADFVPGMVPTLAPGEDVEPFIPSSPGNNYDPFVTLTARGIGAGTGMSFGQVMRHSDGNYSSARQDMLEDRKEWEPEQDLIVDDLLRPTYELWFTFAAIEGRFDGVAGFSLDEFLADRERFLEADFAPPPQTWIDPQKEATAFAILLKNRLITREEIVAMRGQRYWQVIQKLAVEQKQTDELDLSLPENEADRTEVRELLKAWYSNRLGTLDNLAANSTDVEKLVARARLPVRTFAQPELPMQPPDAAGVAPAPAAPPLPAKANGNGNGNGKAKNGRPTSGKLADVAPAAAGPSLALPVLELEVPAGVPDYRDAAVPAAESCATCSWLAGERCSKFGFITSGGKLCDDWRAVTITQNVGAPNTAKTFPPGPQRGSRSLENDFYPQADTTFRG